MQLTTVTWSAYPQARRSAQRLLLPAIEAQRVVGALPDGPLSILDIGAGTGRVAAAAWRHVSERVDTAAKSRASLHFIDIAEPCGGRSFGLSRDAARIESVEWTTGDYRAPLDDEWLSAIRLVHCVLMSRVLCNASTIEIEPVTSPEALRDSGAVNCSPAACLAPRWQPKGTARLQVCTSRRVFSEGITMPQLSLSDYFAAIATVLTGDVSAPLPNRCYLPVRRFNPASLITERGRSVLRQLLKVAAAIIIEDPDLRRNDLVAHARHFGLADAGIIHCAGDRVRTEVEHFAVVRRPLANRLPGTRIW